MAGPEPSPSNPGVDLPHEAGDEWDVESAHEDDRPIDETGPDLDTERPRTPVPPGLQHLFGASNGAAIEARVEGTAVDTPAGRSPEADAAVGGVAAAVTETRVRGDASGDAGVPRVLGPSLHLLAYESEPAAGVIPVGLQPLDDVLGGGLDRGVMLVSGDPGAGKTLLLDEALRSALSGEWWAYYAAFREGTLRAWERLMARASLDDGGLVLPYSAVRGRTLDAASVERLRTLDARFRERSGRRLVFVERLPGGRDGMRSLLENIAWRRHEAREAGAHGPLVLIDDLQTLARSIAASGGDRSTAEALLGGLDAAFVRLGLPALVSAAAYTAAPAGGAAGAGAPAVGASFVLYLVAGEAGEGTELPLELALEKNGRTGWTGRLHVTLDRRVGRFVW